MKYYNKIIVLLFLLNLMIMIGYGSITSVQTFTNPNPTTTPQNKNNSPTTRAFQPPKTAATTPTSKVIKPLSCPKNKVEFCFSTFDQCKNDSDCKSFGENQKCCLRLGCGTRCLKGIYI